MAIGIVTTLPPSVTPDSAPVEEFSAVRALRHVQRIAAEPHPAGTAAHDAARDYLREQLRALSMTVELQQGAHPAVVDPMGRPVPLQNVVAYRPGTTAGRAVLLMAHYDAVADGPGAGDDASGVAAILETLRALGPVPMHNPLIVVFTDGEELGLLGAELFVRQHRYAQMIGVALNFEARGNSGPSYLFQTSPGNASLVREVARAAPHPRANSLTGEVYRRLPNDTDLSVVLRELPGVAALNFAFIGGFRAYHTADDTPAALDLRSVQHQGSWALSLTKRFGAINLEALANDRDAVYFTAPALGLLHYPANWALPMALVVGLSLSAVVMIGHARGRIGWRQLGWGVLTVLVAVVASVLLSAAAWIVIARAVPGGTEFRSELSISMMVFIGMLAFACAVSVGVIALGTRRASPIELTTVAAAAWTLLAITSSAVAPGTSWITTWPAAAMIIALAFAIRPGTTDATRALACAIGAIPALVLVPPVVWQLQVAMTNQVVPLCAGVVALLVLLLPMPLAAAAQQRGV